MDYSDEHLENLASRLKSELNIANRKHRFKTYQNCFVGSEAVAYMVSNNVKYT